MKVVPVPMEGIGWTTTAGGLNMVVKLPIRQSCLNTTAETGLRGCDRVFDGYFEESASEDGEEQVLHRNAQSIETYDLSSGSSRCICDASVDEPPEGHDSVPERSNQRRDLTDIFENQLSRSF